MNGKLLFLDQPREECTIAALTLALAANEQSPALRDAAAALGRPHPICGTAP
ncbi:hypothetical protein GGR43_004372 [Sphingobium jiangsuense]|uniref:Uncharacterized protein n=1 Tax=Sphingobium jiangsuense TaxID=870476 RepID=A0A7W6BRT2_9SPHN|nr:hypothetical protein [Sphingobium jiangsuense]